jgi:cation diffusion facilitator CzcD-associated flavoprotein CzcO
MSFTCKDATIENHRPMTVRVIGAGYSGVYLGIRIPQRLRNVDLQIYEKNAGIGGTWWENRYPGCACDIPCMCSSAWWSFFSSGSAGHLVWLSLLIYKCLLALAAHSYQFTFEPKKDWSGFYAPSKEICDYINVVAEKYGVPRFVKLNHEVTSCTWDEAEKKWWVVLLHPANERYMCLIVSRRVAVRRTDTGETFEEKADVVVSARGNLNQPAWPQIKGLDSFKGEKMHSAAWNQE